MEEEPRTIGKHWQQVKEAFTGACEASVWPKKRKHQEWLSEGNLRMMLSKNNKAPGPDNILAEALKADVETSSQMLYDLFGRIWKKEDVPGEWKEGHLLKIPQKGNLILCDNYRGIMPLSVPGKILNQVILQCLKAAVDVKLRDNQAGFR